MRDRFEISQELKNKYEGLRQYFASLKSVAVAYSSGVDSTFLLYAAYSTLSDKAIAITAKSCLFPERELNEARDYCKKLGVRQLILEENPLNIKGFCQNPTDRCYICKRDLFENIITLAKENGADFVVEGSNLDDEGDYRPGLVAVSELSVKSPLRELRFTKQEIRDLSQYLGIPTFDKPSFACLSSRIPYGQTITAEKLAMIEKAEDELRNLGYRQFRVRLHDNIARIELLSQDIERFVSVDRLKVYNDFKNIGFDYVTMDLLGYRTGSLNETLSMDVLGKNS